MGCFVISQTAAGVRFLLRSDAGQTLAISKNYASLDTCKKGIRSLITILPGAPVVNLTAGERGPNPKCEIDGEEGAYVYRYKSSNGKVVIESRPVQTEKAALRAIAMLKEAVQDPKMMFWQKEGYVPLKLGLPTGEKKPVSAAKAPERVEKKQEPINKPVTLPGDFLIPPESVPEWEPAQKPQAEPEQRKKPESVSVAGGAEAPKKENTPVREEAPAPAERDTAAKAPATAQVQTGKDTSASMAKPAGKPAPGSESVKKVPEKPEKEEKAPAKKRSIFGIFGRIHKLH